MAECHAGGDHCCYMPDSTRHDSVGHFGVCMFLEEDTGGRRWSCELRRTLGSWDAVHTDDRYQRYIAPHMGRHRCGDWPPPGVKCEACGG